MNKLFVTILTFSFSRHPLFALADFTNAFEQALEPQPIPIHYFIHHQDNMLRGVLALTPLEETESDILFLWVYAPISDDDKKEGAWSTATSTFSLSETETGGTPPELCNCATTTIYYIHTDHLSGSNAITNSAGEKTQVVDYYPYGSIRVNKLFGDFDEKHKFTGYENDYSTGLNYAGARYQSPGEGRFTSQDPASRDNPEKFLQNPQAYNSYSYAENNPIVKSDPNGKFVPQAVALGFLYGGLANVAFQGYAGNINSFGDFTYAFASGGAVTAASLVNPLFGGGAAASLSLAGSAGQNGNITLEDGVSAVAQGGATWATGGFLKDLPGVQGVQASKFFGGNYFTGAHGVRYAWEAIFGFSTDVYFENIQNVTQGFINSYQYQPQQSGGGFNVGNTGINQVSQAVINYANTPGADLSDPGFTSSLGAINEYNNNLGRQ